MDKKNQQDTVKRLQELLRLTRSVCIIKAILVVLYIALGFYLIYSKHSILFFLFMIPVVQMFGEIVIGIHFIELLLVLFLLIYCGVINKRIKVGISTSSVIVLISLILLTIKAVAIYLVLSVFNFIYAPLFFVDIYLIYLLYGVFSRLNTIKLNGYLDIEIAYIKSNNDSAVKQPKTITTRSGNYRNNYNNGSWIKED